MRGPEVHEKWRGKCGTCRWGGIADVHAGEHRARAQHGWELGVNDVVRSAANGDCALTDCDIARSRVKCPNGGGAAHVWLRPHEVAVGREVVPHEDGGRSSGEQGADEGNPEHRRGLARETCSVAGSPAERQIRRIITVGRGASNISSFRTSVQFSSPLAFVRLRGSDFRL